MSEPPPKKSRADENVEESITVNNEDEYSSSFRKSFESNQEQTFITDGLEVDSFFAPSPREPPYEHPEVAALDINNENSALEADGSLGLLDDDELEDVILQAGVLESLEDDNAASAPSRRGEDQHHQEGQEEASNLLHWNSVDDQSHSGPFQHGLLSRGGSDMVRASNSPPKDAWAAAPGLVPIAQKGPHSSDDFTGPVAYPATKPKQEREKYNCPVCDRKKKDCKKKCLVFVPGLFPSKNGTLYYFRKRADVRLEQTEPQNDTAESTGATTGYNCSECQQPKQSTHHTEKCIKRSVKSPGPLIHRLAADGKTMMVGFPICSKPYNINGIKLQPELRRISDDVMRELRDFRQKSQEDDEDD